MARTRRSTRGSTRGSRRRSAPVFGKMMPPLDVRSSADVAGLMKRIRNGPLTIVLVYANWCGHCHRFMPHFDKAAQTPGRSVQVAKINEEALGAVNAELSRNNAKPVEVSGYPSVIAVSPAGEVVGNIEAVPETAVMTNVMKNMGTKGKSNSVPIPSAPKNSKAPSPAVNSVANEMNSMRMSMKNTIGNMSVPAQETSEESILNIPEVVTETESESSSVQPVAPPNMEMAEASVEEVVEQKGGSLYSSLIGAAGRIAPAAVLTGIAAATLGPRRSRRFTRRRQSRQKKYAAHR